MSHLARKGFSQTCQTSSQRMSTVTSTKHSQLKNNQRLSICYNRKAARWNSHKCRLLLANNNLVPEDREQMSPLGAILAARVSPRSRSSPCHRQSRVTTSAQGEGHCPGSGVSELQLLVLSSGTGTIQCILITSTLILSLLFNRSSLKQHWWFPSL